MFSITTMDSEVRLTWKTFTAEMSQWSLPLKLRIHFLPEKWKLNWITPLREKTLHKELLNNEAVIFRQVTRGTLILERCLQLSEGSMTYWWCCFTYLQLSYGQRVAEGFREGGSLMPDFPMRRAVPKVQPVSLARVLFSCCLPQSESIG